MNDRYGALTLEGCDIELLFRERLSEPSFRWLYILPQLSHFDFSGFKDPNTFSSLSNTGLTLSLDLDLLIIFSESLGLFVPYSPVKLLDKRVASFSLSSTTSKRVR
jgi:hypothetical protein